MSLYDAILTYIANSHGSAWDEFRVAKARAIALGLKERNAQRWKGPGEPAFVAQLVSNQALSELRGVLVRHLPGHLCNGEPLLSTAFIHQKPKVRFGVSEVELGDLLLVRHHFVYGRPEPQGRALLLQAKAGGSPKTGKLSGNDAEQFRLYKDWPSIQFPNGEVGNAPDGTPDWKFKLGPLHAADAGCYGLVFDHELPLRPATRSRPAFPDGSPWSVGLHSHFLANRVDASKLSLATVLTGLIQGSYGRPFDAVPPPNDHWSAFINEILKNAAAEKWLYRVQRLEIEGRDRLQRVAVLSATMPALAFTLAATIETDWWHSRRLRYSALAKWVDRTDGAGGGGDNVAVRATKQPRGGGIQTLYLATFGNEALPETQQTDRNGER